MFDRIDLHIGHSKTGTTSLQRSFARSAKLLGESGVFYWTGRRTHAALVHSFRPNRGAKGNPEKLRARFLEAAAASDAPRAFLSAEVLALLPSPAKRELVALLHRVAREVHVLLYVRHPVAMASSAAQQGLKQGKRIAASLERPRVLPLRYIVCSWAEAVGRQNVTVRPYDRSLLTGGDIVDDVLDYLGLSGISAAITRERHNESLSHPAALLLDEAIAAIGGPLPRTSLEPFFLIGGPKFRLPAEVLADVREASAPELSFLEQEFGLVLPDPEVRDGEPAAFDPAAVRSIAHLLFALGHHADLHRRSLLTRLRGDRVWTDTLAALSDGGGTSFVRTGRSRPARAAAKAGEGARRSAVPARRSPAGQAPVSASAPRTKPTR